MQPPTFYTVFTPSYERGIADIISLGLQDHISTQTAYGKQIFPSFTFPSVITPHHPDSRWGTNFLSILRLPADTTTSPTTWPTLSRTFLLDFTSTDPHFAACSYYWAILPRIGSPPSLYRVAYWKLDGGFSWHHQVFIKTIIVHSPGVGGSILSSAGRSWMTTATQMMTVPISSQASWFFTQMPKMHRWALIPTMLLEGDHMAQHF